MKKIEKLVKIGEQVLEAYDGVANLIIDKRDNYLFGNDFEKLVKKVKKLVDAERKLYSNLTIDEINECIEILKSKKDLNYIDIRINNRLEIYYNKLNGTAIKNEYMVSGLDYDFEFSLMDLISSKLVIDIYKNIDEKLDDISVNDSKSVSYLSSLVWLNFQFVIYKLALFDVSERFSLNRTFYIDKIPTIIGFYLDKYCNGNFKDFINNKVFHFLISKINEFSELKMNEDDYNTIYDNLLYVSMFEVLTAYLNKKQLEFILAYFSRINSDNVMVSNNIKSLIKKRITQV